MLNVQKACKRRSSDARSFRACPPPNERWIVIRRFHVILLNRCSKKKKTTRSFTINLVHDPFEKENILERDGHYLDGTIFGSTTHDITLPMRANEKPDALTVITYIVAIQRVIRTQRVGVSPRFNPWNVCAPPSSGYVQLSRLTMRSDNWRTRRTLTHTHIGTITGRCDVRSAAEVIRSWWMVMTRFHFTQSSSSSLVKYNRVPYT